MSKKLEGKVSNQFPNPKMGKCLCAKCSKIIDMPVCSHLQTDEKQFYTIFHYLNHPYYVYETNRGRAVVYCSDYCRREHNHRFRR